MVNRYNAADPSNTIILHSEGTFVFFSDYTVMERKFHATVRRVCVKAIIEAVFFHRESSIHYDDNQRCEVRRFADSSDRKLAVRDKRLLDVFSTVAAELHLTEEERNVLYKSIWG